MSNLDRVACAERALQAHTKGKHIGDPDDLTDLLTDLRHLALFKGIDFETCNILSTEHFVNEKGEGYHESN